MATQTKARQGQRQPQPAMTAEEAQQRIDDQYVSYLEDAQAIKEADEAYAKSGLLHGRLYDKLEPLLMMPTPPAYIEHRPKGDGNPFPTTGLKSAQVQIDRMNDVLGKRHWRVLLHYTQQGTLCKAVVVVGNALHFARLDDAGNLIPFTYVEETAEGGQVERSAHHADVIAMHEGWGGWKSRTTGDTFKAAETNALKRVLARFGPGADVYRVDYEEDILTALKGEEPPPTGWQQNAQGNAARQPQPPAPRQQPAPAQRQAPPQQAAPPQQQAPPQPPPLPTEDEAEARLKALLEEDAGTVQHGDQQVPLSELRNAVNEAMMALPEASRPSVVQRLALIGPRKDDPQQLRDLLVRAQNAAAQG